LIVSAVVVLTFCSWKVGAYSVSALGGVVGGVGLLGLLLESVRVRSARVVLRMSVVVADDFSGLVAVGFTTIVAVVAVVTGVLVVGVDVDVVDDVLPESDETLLSYVVEGVAMVYDLVLIVGDEVDVKDVVHIVASEERTRCVVVRSPSARDIELVHLRSVVCICKLHVNEGRVRQELGLGHGVSPNTSSMWHEILGEVEFVEALDKAGEAGDGTAVIRILLFFIRLQRIERVATLEVFIQVVGVDVFASEDRGWNSALLLVCVGSDLLVIITIHGRSRSGFLALLHDHASS
jgi:hypothetical protein